MTPLKGQCLCGEIAFKVAPPEHIDACHCQDCRRWSGSPNMSLDFTAIDFTAQKTLKWYRSSDWAERGFCSACGSSLFYRLVEDPDKMTVCAGAIDGLSDDVKITKEFFIDKKPEFYDFGLDNEKLTGAEVFALYGAAEED